jgi:hypothetical protein
MEKEVILPVVTEMVMAVPGDNLEATGDHQAEALGQEVNSVDY